MILGIDMGGTHIDGVIVDRGKIIETIKNPRDHKDLFKTIWTAIQDLLNKVEKNDISRIHLSTTVSTNAIVEKKTAKVGMVLQTGPGMDYGFKEYWDNLEFVSGYVDHRGEVVKEIDDSEINAVKDKFLKEKVEALAVVSKFSVRNPSNEIFIKEMMDDSFDPITMGHSMSGKLNFPRRVHTSYLNAAISKNFQAFADNIEKALKEEGIRAPVYVLKADGGTMDLKTAKRKPVETILSGPAASYMGMSALVDYSQDGILLDIGGTTTDIFFVANGVPLFEPLGITIDGHPSLVRSIFSHSMGLGGDSHIELRDGDFKIGPRRLGKPMAFGGTSPTPTDAMVVLGELKEGDHLKATQALSVFAQKLGLSEKEVASKILDSMVSQIVERVNTLLLEINSKAVYTIKELLEDLKLKPQFVAVIGGPAEILSDRLEKAFKLKLFYPTEYKLANAIGAALAKPTLEINMAADTDRRRLSVPELEIYEVIDRNYNLKKAEKRALDLVMEAAMKLGADKDNLEAEIVESSSFNMIKGYSGASKNIRVKAQVKPGLFQTLIKEID